MEVSEDDKGYDGMGQRIEGVIARFCASLSCPKLLRNPSFTCSARMSILVPWVSLHLRRDCQHRREGRGWIS